MEIDELKSSHTSLRIISKRLREGALGCEVVHDTIKFGIPPASPHASKRNVPRDGKFKMFDFGKCPVHGESGLKFRPRVGMSQTCGPKLGRKWVA